MKFPAFSILLIRAVTVAAALLALASCAINDREDDAFLGQPSARLLASLGTPQLRAPDGNGGEIWTYIEQRGGATAPAGGGALSARQSAGPLGPGSGTMVSSGFTAKREFLIDSSGNVYRHRTKGL